MAEEDRSLGAIEQELLSDVPLIGAFLARSFFYRAPGASKEVDLSEPWAKKEVAEEVSGQPEESVAAVGGVAEE